MGHGRIGQLTILALALGLGLAAAQAEEDKPAVITGGGAAVTGAGAGQGAADPVATPTPVQPTQRNTASAATAPQPAAKSKLPDEGGEIMSRFGFDVRALANDKKKCSGGGKEYFIGDLVTTRGSKALSVWPSSATVRFQMHDFISPKSGLTYFACGYSEVTDKNPLMPFLTGEVLKRDTLRFYWMAIEYPDRNLPLR